MCLLQPAVTLQFILYVYMQDLDIVRRERDI